MSVGRAYHAPSAPAPTGSQLLNNLTLFAGCVAIWSTTWLAITWQIGPVAPEISVAWRFLLAASIIAAWCRLRSLPLRFRPAEHAVFALMGVTLYSVGYIFIYHAERYIVSGLVALGYSASPLLSMIGMRVAFRQPVTARMVIGSLLGLAGIALVFWPEFDRLAESRDVARGALFTVLAVLITTAGGLVAHRNHQRRLHGLPTMAWSMGYGGACALAVALALGRPVAFDFSAPYVLSLLYLTLLGTIATFGAWLALLGRIGPARASYVGVMVPIVALMISTLFEGLAWHPLTVLGIAVSVGGNVLVLRNAPRLAQAS
ncbi:MAG TPA: DMT family transporter [Burkholderiales bacterium]|nr:DMT family transporter [Burkholderiales bacterium]